MHTWHLNYMHSFSMAVHNKIDQILDKYTKFAAGRRATNNDLKNQHQRPRLHTLEVRRGHFCCCCSRIQ